MFARQFVLSFLLDLITVRDPDDDDDSPDPRTLVAVEVSDTKNGATHYWSIDKLRYGNAFFPPVVSKFRSFFAL